MRSFTALLGVALMCACGGDGGVIDPPRESITLDISSQDVMTSAGDTRSVSAVVRSGDFEAGLPATELTWTSSAPSVATVSVSGPSATITAVDDGTATITATKGGTTGTVTVTVRRALASIQVTAPSRVLIVGSSTQLTATARDARGNALPGLTDFRFVSSNARSVVVSTSGLATALFAPFNDQGATVTATATRDGVTASGTATIGVTPPPVGDFAALMLTEYVRPAPVSTGAQGLASFYVDGDRLNYLIAWSALSSPAMSVHIHGPAGSAEVADVLVDFVPGAQTATYGMLSGSLTAADIHPPYGQPAISIEGLISLIRDNRVYVDLHTTTYRDGEIRGQVIDLQQ